MSFTIQWFSGTGKGGQHRNKHQNCCRVKHVETGITANGTSNRSRVANYREAMNECTRRVAEHYHVDVERFRAGEERVRTYHEPDNRVTDHASGETMSYKAWLKDPSKMIDARRRAISEG